MANKVGIFSYSKASGKTTTCGYLASALSLVGKKVRIVDLDGSVKKLVALSEFKAGNDWDINDSFSSEASDVDYILVDFPSAEEYESDEILQNLDSVIIPVEAEFYGLENLNKTLEKISAFDKLLIKGILLTKCNSNSSFHKELEGTLNEYFSQFVFDSKIFRNYYLSLPHFAPHTINENSFNGGFIDYLKLANEIIDNES